MMTDGFNDFRIKENVKDTERYLKRRTSKHNAEMALIERAIKTLEIKTIIDVPCGVGRASKLFTEKGLEVTAVDAGKSAVAVTKKTLADVKIPYHVLEGDIRALSFADQNFDAAFCFRFFHHLKTEEARLLLISELTRITQHYVLISYFSPLSFTSLKRKIRHALGGKKSVQQTTSLAEMQVYFKQQGFELAKDHAQLAYLHTLHLAIFKRI
jgi:SAM-dependent methyltransferase